jgi:hypothetical protein
MQGDFTRVTYDAARHIRRVLTQQGRVQLDADTNEQTAALLHVLQTMMADLVGPYAAPRPAAANGRDGFRIDAGDAFDVTISPGHYWVDGILCENDASDGVAYSKQPDYPADKPRDAGKWVLYLDVWERHLCADEAPWIREVALDGPDTSSRSQLVWQVRLTDHFAGQFSVAAIRKNFPSLVDRLQPPRRGSLAARATAPAGPSDPCLMPPDSRYRGPENQLYRVEIHDPGAAGVATFKWSRDNASVVMPVRTARGTRVVLDRLSLDRRFTLEAGRDWIELIDDEVTLRGDAPGRLLEVVGVDPDELAVTVALPAGADPLPAYREDATTHPLVRRWDQGGDAIVVTENTWLDLEDGVQIRFAAAPDGGRAHEYRTGDHWMIPARVVTGDVEWPDDPAGGPASVGPHGVEHHYAPLAMVTFDAAGGATLKDLRRRIIELWEDV